MDIENNLKYGIPKGYLSTRMCCPKMLDVEVRCESRSKDQYQSIYTHADHTNHVMNYDSNKNMSEENLSRTVLIPHVSEEKVVEKFCDTTDIEMEIILVTTPYDNNNSFSNREIPQEVHPQSCVSDESNSVYEELESCTSDEENASMQDFNDIDSISQKSVMCDDKNLIYEVPPFFVDNTFELESCTVCLNE